MLDREIHIRFTLRQLFCRAWVPPVLVVLAFFVLAASLGWGGINWAGVNWSGWVQAVGSLIAIGIAIAVPSQQWRLARKEKMEDAMRADYQKALMGLRGCIEVDEFLADLIRRSGGDRNGWHNRELFIGKAAILHQRVAALISAENNAQWWNLFLDAQGLLLEIESALKMHGLDSPIVRILAQERHESWNLQLTMARANLDKVERDHGHILHKGIWENGQSPSE